MQGTNSTLVSCGIAIYSYLVTNIYHVWLFETYAGIPFNRIVFIILDEKKLLDEIMEHILITAFVAFPKL